MLSRIFGVSTDFLLKEEYEREQMTQDENGAPADFKAADDDGSADRHEEVVACRRIGSEEAADFLEHEASWATRMGFGVMMCIL